MADRFRVVAIVSAYNEADVISPVIGHLVEQGVEVYLIDNRSTDDTVERARPWLKKGLIGLEEFPKEAPGDDSPHAFDWGAILTRKEELAKELPADWFIHHDADEFREAPWPGMTLQESIRWVDRLGYNCIDFRVLNFPPVDDGFRPGSDPRKHFPRWEEPIVHDTVQLKCWKNTGVPLSLAASGGHEARFRGRRVFPIQFLLKHYPIRGQEHGRRKVFEERKGRFLEEEREKGWHVQYDRIADEGHSFLGDPEKLHLYDPDRVRLDLMLRNQQARHSEERARELATALDRLQKELAVVAATKHEAERHAANLEKDRQKLTDHLIDGERHAANLEATRAHLERHAAGLEKDREGLATRLADRERHAVNLENTVAELQRHAAGLERDRETLARHISHLEEVRMDRDRHVAGLEDLRAERERHVGHLESERAEADRHAADLEQRLGEMRNSTIWRLTAPLRRVLDWLKRSV